MGGARPEEADTVRVLIVDDSSDMRTMLRLLLGRDDRFTVLGEAANGREAIDVAGSLQPDLVVLDRQMPVLGGIEAIPLIRQAAPRSEIVLYTAGPEEDSEAAAIAAGALGMLEKQTVVLSVVEDLAEMLVAHWANPAADVEVRVGPLPSSCARLWVENTVEIMDAVRRHPEVIGDPVPDEVLDMYAQLLDSWGTVARETEVFFWVGRARPDEVRRLVEEWARVDSMGDERMAQLGCHWSGPEARPFFTALTEGVLDALRKHEDTRRLAERLSHGAWPAVSGRGGPDPASTGAEPEKP